MRGMALWIGMGWLGMMAEPLMAVSDRAWAASGEGGSAQALQQLDEAQTWDLEAIYPTPQAWAQAYEAFEAKLAQVTAFSGKLGRDAKTLLDFLEQYEAVTKELDRLVSYASMRSDEDTRRAADQRRLQEASQLVTRAMAALSFVHPEIQALGQDTIAAFVAQQDGLKPFRFHLEEILRMKPHTLEQDQEQLLAMAGQLGEAPGAIYRVLTNAELPWPEVTLPDGQRLLLDQAGYAKGRALPDRASRKLVFDRFWGLWQGYSKTLGTALYQQMQRDSFFARARHYDSALEAALYPNDIPEGVYHALLQAANAHLGTLQRYLRLRQRLLGLEDLAYYDVYPPLVPGERHFTIEEAKKLVLQAVKPLGETYQRAMRQGFEQRWMDVYPRTGKRSGAYMNGGVYDVHPFVLMNYQDDYESVSTLAHEWGHAMHSYLANGAQRYINAQYPIFLAEVASTFNEALLLRAMLEQSRNDEDRLFYLGNALEQLRGTFFRQAMFAEFEYKAHQAIEQGAGYTGEDFTTLYGELVRRYHGAADGVMHIDDRYTVEWAYIPHFYSAYYVYQYATSVAAASLLAEEVLEHRQGAAERYLRLLSAGGSAHPYELLKEAGVDLAEAAPYEALMRRMEGIMDQMEAILAKRQAAS